MRRLSFLNYAPALIPMLNDCVFEVRRSGKVSSSNFGFEVPQPSSRGLTIERILLLHSLQAGSTLLSASGFRLLAGMILFCFKSVWTSLTQALAGGDVVVTFIPSLPADIMNADADDADATEMKACAIAASESYIVTGSFRHTEMMQQVYVSGLEISVGDSPPMQSLHVFERFYGACESGAAFCTHFEAGVIGLDRQGQLTDIDALPMIEGLAATAALKDQIPISSERIFERVQL